ncbi:histidine phosphatase family protein [Mycobacterium koreense]|uniref:Histidine phosphatase family protein n=1 Tax=Mycolicibacillus koreensis TaxID=1069220 RepID=A0A7I7SH82_9MYCO|nr:histidine phosphatase family protein [Mycolicibacillus koreensis]MCV7250119.1 histidine phosphatase family protein [Mycolicibacillus koreensis]ODR04433.1 phosphoglycerate kinase [Mycolicibacillus koreensis]OSC31814.1 histidine phosphatase family protein [Mycolicibacillus koreensis]BBY56113.1 phosphoglycerate mutase [Mycolicibacillus koreensis]
MQLLLVRHALPLRSEPGQGADPDLSEAGREQAGRLPAALSRYPLARLVSSPQRRAVQTAEPVAAERGLTIDVDERFAEYDRNLHAYVPIEQIRAEQPEAWARMSAGHLPPGVDETQFCARVADAVADVVASAAAEDTVAVFSHGGVINVVLHQILGTARLLSFPIDYVSVTRLLFSRSGRASVVAVNGSEHVWDLLPRNNRQEWVRR